MIHNGLTKFLKRAVNDKPTNLMESVQVMKDDTEMFANGLVVLAMMKFLDNAVNIMPLLVIVSTGSNVNYIVMKLIDLVLGLAFCKVEMAKSLLYTRLEESKFSASSQQDIWLQNYHCNVN
jgi:hypothetical protein